MTYKSETVIDYTGGMTTNGKFQLLPTIDCTPAVVVPTTDSSGTTTPTASTGSTCVDQTASEIKADVLPFNATQEQKDMLEWHNKCRTDPTSTAAGSCIAELKTMLTYFGTGDNAKKYSVPGKTTILTNEGAPAV